MTFEEWQRFCIRARIKPDNWMKYRHRELTKLDRIVDITGSAAKLGKIIGVSTGLVNRWINPNDKVHRDVMPFKYNDVLISWAKENVWGDGYKVIEANIEWCCSMCGRAYD